MTFEVAINGRTRRVEVEKTAGGFVVSLDGHRHAADVTVINGVWSLILGPAEAGPHDKQDVGVDLPPSHEASADRHSLGDGGRVGPRRSYEIAIVDNGSGALTVHVNGRLVTVSVGRSRASRARAQHDAGDGGAGPQRVAAPMPGKVVKMMVRPGDRVAARQAVVVVEAMKMENELRASRAGTVAEVHATEGMSVDAGAVLVVIT